MPAAKCGGCAKYLSPIEAAKCNQCNAYYHRACVALPAVGFIAGTWRCPECNRNVVRDNKADTPVRGRTTIVHAETCTPEELMDTSQLDSSALNVTLNSSPDFAAELHLFKEELRKEFRQMHLELQQLRDEMAQLQVSLKTSDERMDNLEVRLSSMELKVEQKVFTPDPSLQNTIAELKMQLNERDQELYNNDVEITGIPETKEESTLHIIKTMAVKLGVSIDERDVVHAERVGSTLRNRIDSSGGNIPADPAVSKPRSIAVRFARRATRDTLLRAARVRRGLCTDDLDIRGSSPPRRVYINERLTKQNRQLFYLARQAGSKHNWRYVWTRGGRILARRVDGDKAERIRCEDDVVRIFG